MKRTQNSTSLRVSEDIVPLNEFKARLSEKLRALKGRQRPFIVTQNGKAAAVVLSPEEFDKLVHERRFVSAVAEGLEDLEAGRVVKDDELTRRLDARFGKASRKG